MKKLITLTVLLLTMMSLGFQVAEAKRFGGGKSYGFSKKMFSTPKKSKSSNTSQSNAKQSTPTAPANNKSSGMSRFLGPLAGLAAGGLLASMFFGEGFEGLQIMDILLFGLIGLAIWMFFKRRRASSGTAHAYSGGPFQQTSPNVPPAQSQSGNNTSQQYFTSSSNEKNSATDGIVIGSGLSENANVMLVAPDWFDEASFIEGAKGHFKAVQKAWDEADVSELKSYCSDEFFAAMQAEMIDLKAGDNHTEVLELDAETSTMATEGDYFIVSVRFSGLIKEDSDSAQEFTEIWHIRRLTKGEGNWQIAGIQQLS